MPLKDKATELKYRVLMRKLNKAAQNPKQNKKGGML